METRERSMGEVLASLPQTELLALTIVALMMLAAMIGIWQSWRHERARMETRAPRVTHSSEMPSDNDVVHSAL